MTWQTHLGLGIAYLVLGVSLPSSWWVVSAFLGFVSGMNMADAIIKYRKQK